MSSLGWLGGLCRRMLARSAPACCALALERVCGVAFARPGPGLGQQARRQRQASSCGWATPMMHIQDCRRVLSRVWRGSTCCAPLGPTGPRLMERLVLPLTWRRAPRSPDTAGGRLGEEEKRQSVSRCMHETPSTPFFFGVCFTPR